MNAVLTPPRIDEARRRGVPDWLLVCLGIVLFYGLLALGVTSFFRLSRDTAALEKAVVSTLPPDTVRMVTVNIGPLTTGAVRTGLSFVDLPHEARAGIKTLRAAEVSVYRLGQSSDCLEQKKVFVGADKVMKQRGWTRVVGVIEDGAVVAVYVPTKASRPERIRCCVAVLKDRDLVIAGVTGDLAPVLQLVQEQLAKEMGKREFAKRDN